MVNVQLSPGDPLFWLHHAWLDSLWWRWQSQDLARRVQDFAGPNMPPQATLNFSTPGGGSPFGGGAGGGALPPGCFGGFVPTVNGTFQLPNGTNAGNVTRPGTPFGGAGGLFNPNATNPFGGGVNFTNPFAFKENKAITAYFGDGGGKFATFNHTLWSAGVQPNATVADVMDIRGPYVCADYV